MQPNAISFYTLDREDPSFYGALVFKVNNTKTNEDAFNEIKGKLESPEFISFFIEKICLPTYKFKSVCYKKYGLYFEFINSANDDIREYRMEAEFVYVME